VAKAASTWATFCNVAIVAWEGSVAKKFVARTFRSKKARGDFEEAQAGNAFGGPERNVPVAGNSNGRSIIGAHSPRLTDASSVNASFAALWVDLAKSVAQCGKHETMFCST
jgi:hypothetical protein